MSPPATAVSIIVPAYREADNLQPLIERTFAALDAAAIKAELIIVDDNSQDGTDQIVASLTSRYPVTLIVRRHQRGLSSAVLAGFDKAQSDRFVVMDADLQHPPEMLPAIVTQLDTDDCDFVIGTRYGAGGALDEDWPLRRRLISRFATLLAKPLAPLSDPMSGFFALHRRTWEQAAPLDPIGYKIALELYVKGRCHRPAEVPFSFAARTAGESKLSPREQLRYLRHLVRLYRFRFPWLARLALPLLFASAVAATLLLFWT